MRIHPRLLSHFVAYICAILTVLLFLIIILVYPKKGELRKFADQ